MDTESGDSNRGSVEPCEDKETPCVQEGKREGEESEEPALTGNQDDSHGPGWLDYVSDSQLNTIDLNEQEVVQKQEAAASHQGLEDASELICGLIRELSSLNRTVMVAHRELENLRRTSKASRKTSWSSIR
ncbi:uncharacterized protein ACNS7B_005779 [Menidia menidia]